MHEVFAHAAGCTSDRLTDKCPFERPEGSVLLLWGLVSATMLAMQWFAGYQSGHLGVHGGIFFDCL